jgi:hypothetical protein
MSTKNDLNKLLNDWDFLAAVVLGEDDEYTDLLEPIINKLKQNVDQKELASFLKEYITKKYGYTPKFINENSERILKWWNNGETKSFEPNS